MAGPLLACPPQGTPVLGILLSGTPEEARRFRCGLWKHRCGSFLLEVPRLRAVSAWEGLWTPEP